MNWLYSALELFWRKQPTSAAWLGASSATDVIHRCHPVPCNCLSGCDTFHQRFHRSI